MSTHRGSRRWPGHYSSQSPNLAPLLVFDVWVHVQPFLAPKDCRTLHCVSSPFSSGILCSHLWLTRPWQTHRRRCFGFGKVSRDLSATTDRPTFFHIYHHLWPFLTPAERHLSQALIREYNIPRCVLISFHWSSNKIPVQQGQQCKLRQGRKADANKAGSECGRIHVDIFVFSCLNVLKGQQER